MNTRDTRQNILDAVQRLIETGGFTRLTTKEIAREAGVAEGTLFKYFRTKEDLCLAVVLENAPKFREMIAQMQPGKRSVVRNLEDLALAAIRFSEKLIPLGVTLLADTTLLQRHRVAMQGRENPPQEVFNLIARYIESEKRLGRINSRVKPLSVAALLFGPCFHWAFVRQGIGKGFLPQEDEEFVRGLVATLALGISPGGDGSEQRRLKKGAT
jgi:AcrR family transcriptional regulator